MNVCRGRCTNSLPVAPALQFKTRVGAGVKNRDLLEMAEREFDLFITADQNIRYQQNLIGRRIAILELSTNDIGRIQSARGLTEETITTLGPHEFRHLLIP